MFNAAIPSPTPYQINRVTIERVEMITPRTKRITFIARHLIDFRDGLPAQWLKVFVPLLGGGRTSGRPYTVRHYNPASKRMAIDFVLHGDHGPTSAWAARAKVGDAFEISPIHPRSGYPIEPADGRYLLIGDETALPAIGGVLEALPPGCNVDALISIADRGEEQTLSSAASINVKWLHRGTGSGPSGIVLVEAAGLFGRPALDTRIWIAAESTVVQSIRKYALSQWGIDRTRFRTAGYWKEGEAAHKDEAADG